jgi:RimJ/RimL family protein N-acetyltransferase
MPSYWPLFDLRVETERLVLRLPTDDDFPGLLDAIDAGIHDPETMPFTIPWTDVEPEERRISAVQHWWGARANWSTDDWNLNLAVFQDGRAIGFQGLLAKQFDDLRQVDTGSWLTKSAQGRGLGKEMRAAVLQLAFEHLEAEIARSGAFVDNAASAGVSRAIGYRENGRSRLLRRGAPGEIVNFELTREEWLERRDSLPRATVTGFEAARPMFGLGPGQES